MLKLTLKILFIIIVLLLFLSVESYPQWNYIYFPYGYTVKAKVARVIDGDTFVLSDSQHVRILGINCPELAYFNKPAEPYSNEASLKTKSLIENKIVKLTFDGNIHDIFGRVLAYVWLTDIKGKDSLFIQAELLKAGLAHISYYPKGKRYYHLFYNLRRTAIKNKLGIWKHD